MVKKMERRLERLSLEATKWIGSPISLIFHTIFFAGIFLLYKLGVKTEQIMLILTTLVSLEAIYLAIFIQMSVNKNLQNLEVVEDNIENLQEDIEEIQADDDSEEDRNKVTSKTLASMESNLKKLQAELDLLKHNKYHSHN